MVMGYSGHSIPTMIVGAILTAILIFVGVRFIPESDITTQEMTKQTTTQETEKQARNKNCPTTQKGNKARLSPSERCTKANKSLDGSCVSLCWLQSMDSCKAL